MRSEAATQEAVGSVCLDEKQSEKDAKKVAACSEKTRCSQKINVVAAHTMGDGRRQGTVVGRGDSPKYVCSGCCVKVTRGVDLYGGFVWEKERKWERGLGNLFTMGE